MTTEERAEALIHQLDEIARDRCSYDYGLPVASDEHMPRMRDAVTLALHEQHDELAKKVQTLMVEQMAHWPTCLAWNDFTEAGWDRCSCHLKPLRTLLAGYLGNGT